MRGELRPIDATWHQNLVKSCITLQVSARFFYDEKSFFEIFKKMEFDQWFLNSSGTFPSAGLLAIGGLGLLVRRRRRA
jgi:LPXTG-motif cell wall-anchored protein